MPKKFKTYSDEEYNERRFKKAKELTKKKRAKNRRKQKSEFLDFSKFKDK